MPRRPPVNSANIRGSGKVKASEVWRVFECFTEGCDQLLKVREDWLEEQRSLGNAALVTCSKCNATMPEDVVQRAARWKYCSVCAWLQPLENFDRHAPTSSSFRSGRQPQCRYCKRQVNRVLNPLRTSDQHREAGQGRRLYGMLAGDEKIDSEAVFRRFDGMCFNCGKPLHYKARGRTDFDLDHTLPVRLLWPLTTQAATLLCRGCNNAKHDKWPAEFYRPEQLRRLSVLTSIPYDVVSGPAKINAKAVTALLANADRFISRWIRYPDEIKAVRRLILEMSGLDLYAAASTVPDFLKG